MAWTVIDHFVQGSIDKNSFTSTARNTTGAKLLLLAVNNSDTSITPTDSLSNTWILAVDNSVHYDIRLYYAKNPNVGASHTFTLTVPGGSSRR